MKQKLLTLGLLSLMIIPIFSFKNQSYYDKLVKEYGNADAVREYYLPTKSNLKKHLKEFFFNKNGDAIEISGTSKLHTYRNRYNTAPSNISKARKSTLWEEASIDYGYHGGKPEFRGKGRYAGCQAVYDLGAGGLLDDFTRHMGTFDYAYYYYGGTSMWYYNTHKKWDIRPHNSNNNYETGLTKTY